MLPSSGAEDRLQSPPIALIPAAVRPVSSSAMSRIIIGPGGVGIATMFPSTFIPVARPPKSAEGSGCSSETNRAPAPPPGRIVAECQFRPTLPTQRHPQRRLGPPPRRGRRRQQITVIPRLVCSAAFDVGATGGPVGRCSHGTHTEYRWQLEYNLPDDDSKRNRQVHHGTKKFARVGNHNNLMRYNM
mmetsp:Transcript_40922/g.123414  ORF Transcript_40922/g.123414 Transcript_40922/m.123414 type:complete len:187 (-) Transcript_40922:745-1305(-)